MRACMGMVLERIDEVHVHTPEEATQLLCARRDVTLHFVPAPPVFCARQSDERFVWDIRWHEMTTLDNITLQSSAVGSKVHKFAPVAWRHRRGIVWDLAALFLGLAARWRHCGHGQS